MASIIIEGNAISEIPLLKEMVEKLGTPPLQNITEIRDIQIKDIG